MHELDRIEALLAETDLDSAKFERFAQDVLSPHYPLANALTGGSDWGRDADARVDGDPIPYRIMATKGASLKSVLANVRAGLRSLRDHGQDFKHIVTISPASLSRSDKEQIAAAAAELGAIADVADIYGREFIASKLRRDGDWRSDLLGLSSEPISLSRVPSSLAESPWGDLTLRGRTPEVEMVRNAGDLVVYGSPGVGKSRLLRSLDDVAFVDPDADREQVARDLRWLAPSTVVIDDAGLNRDLLDAVTFFRRSEPDTFNYRVVAVCWPDDVEDIQRFSLNVTVCHVDLLEREPLDLLVQEMGVTGELARREILGQAEGRAGWAVALADILLREEDRTPVLTGGLVLDNVRDYFRRTGGAESVEVLGLIALLGSVRSDQLNAMAQQLELPRRELARRIEACATGGVLDVGSRYIGLQEPQLVRVYTVRPPILANALVGYVFFAPFAPVLDLREVVTAWPENLESAAVSALTAAGLRTASAAHSARWLYGRALEMLDRDGSLRVAFQYAYLSYEAAQEVIEMISNDLSRQESESDSQVDPYQNDRSAEICTMVLRRWKLTSAVRMLLRMSVFDGRSYNATPARAVRQIGDAIRSFHPEVPYDFEIRVLIADQLRLWVSDLEPGSNSQVISTIVESLLSPSLSSSTTDPSKPRTLNLRETVLPVSLMDRVPVDIWGRLRQANLGAHPAVFEGAIRVTMSWLRIGKGVDRPFGADHPKDRVAAAAVVGARLLELVLAEVSVPLGSIAQANALSAQYELGVHVPIPADMEVYFEIPDRVPGDLLRAADLYEEKLRANARSLLAVPHSEREVLEHIKRVKVETERAHLSWPMRAAILCSEIARNVDNCGDWLAAAIELRLFPEGGVFVAPVVRDAEVSRDFLTMLLESNDTRSSAMAAILDGSCPDWMVDVAIRQINYSLDQRELKHLALRSSIATPTIRRLLRESREVATVTAVAISVAHRHDLAVAWSDIETDWRDAVANIDLSILKHDRHDLEAFFDLALMLTPGNLCVSISWVLKRTDLSVSAYARIPFELWERLGQLPADQKAWLLSEFIDNEQVLFFLQSQLVGRDFGWVAEALDSDLISLDAAMSALGSVEDVPIDEVAPILVPRGASPLQVAVLREFGTWMGEQSDRYSELVVYFTGHLDSQDTSTRNVARAGVEYCESRRSEALERERKARIRGQ